MQRHRVGKSGVELSRIGLRGCELGPEPGEEPDADRAARVIAAAFAGSRSGTHTRDNAGAGRLALSPDTLARIEELIPLSPTQVVSA